MSFLHCYLQRTFCVQPLRNERVKKQSRVKRIDTDSSDGSINGKKTNHLFSVTSKRTRYRNTTAVCVDHFRDVLSIVSALPATSYVHDNYDKTGAAKEKLIIQCRACAHVLYPAKGNASKAIALRCWISIELEQLNVKQWDTQFSYVWANGHPFLCFAYRIR